MVATSRQQTGAEKADTIRVVVACRTVPGIHCFDVSPQLKVGQFLEQVLEHLAHRDSEGRLEALRHCYEPQLELQLGNDSETLDNNLTLEQAGVTHQSVCRISGNPRKEEIMFCRHS